MIELVVFDMDGVLAQLDRPRRLALLSEMTGKPPAFLQAAIWDSSFEPGAEVGAYATGAEYLAEWNRRTGCRLTRAQWVRARREAMTVQHDTLGIAAALLDQCGIAMLTNNGALLYEALPEIFPEMFRCLREPRARFVPVHGAASRSPRCSSGSSPATACHRVGRCSSTTTRSTSPARARPG